MFFQFHLNKRSKEFDKNQISFYKSFNIDVLWCNELKKHLPCHSLFWNTCTYDYIDTYTQISDVIHIPKIHHINMNIYSPIVDMKWTIYYSIKRLQNNDRKLNYSAYY